MLLLLGTDHLTWRGVCFVQNLFFGQHKSSNIYFFCGAKREFFPQNLTLGYMTKTLNQIIFFFFHQNQNIFFSNIGNQNIFFFKTILMNKPQPWCHNVIFACLLCSVFSMYCLLWWQSNHWISKPIKNLNLIQPQQIDKVFLLLLLHYNLFTRKP